ncbi:LacI family DNA-binding transcriptional regulator, partial [Streptomyces sp. NPDC001215]
MNPAKPVETQTATLAEIARAAGVSAPTVSKVLNGRADVAPATRSRVEELLRTHGYRRRRTEATRSPLIDVVFHELESAWAMEVIRGAKPGVCTSRGETFTATGTRSPCARQRATCPS